MGYKREGKIIYLKPEYAADLDKSEQTQMMSETAAAAHTKIILEIIGTMVAAVLDNPYGLPFDDLLLECADTILASYDKFLSRSEIKKIIQKVQSLSADIHVFIQTVILAANQ